MNVQPPLPPEYIGLEPEAYRERIQAAKRKLGNRVVVLGHHYQRDEIIEHADFRGDSYKLAKEAKNRPDAEFIVFCGVHFMAESADILTPDHQKVVLPNLAAGCSMADMASAFQVRRSWRELSEVLGDLQGKVMPVTYINSAASLKAIVGANGGTVCTSSNAQGAIRWALDRAERLLFFPDQHLGRNSGAAMGFDPDRDMAVWDPAKPLGGLDPEQIRDTKFLLWKGHCSVHQRFTVDQIAEARAKHPKVKVIVHPECTMEVVQAADLNGSTEFILKTIERGRPGDVWAVGTEINMVSRLAKEHPEQTIFCLDPQVCPCATMYRIHPSFLCWAMESLAGGHLVNQIKVPTEVAEPARLALDRMLQIS